MICFGYPKLTLNISMAFIHHDCRLYICARANFAHAFLRICFDNTAKTLLISGNNITPTIREGQII